MKVKFTMSDHDTSIPNNYSESYEEEPYNSSDWEYNTKESDYNYYLLLTVHQWIIRLVLSVLSLVTLIVGVASWCIIKKFRNYRNFVFLNGLLSNFLLYSTLMRFCFVNSSLTYAMYWLSEYLETAKCHWLVVISHMFYVDIIKVFKRHYFQRRYLKSTLFGWGVPLIPIVVLAIINLYYYYIFDYIKLMFSMGAMSVIMWAERVISLVMNLFFYFVIVFSLCRSLITRKQTLSNVLRRLYFASLVFILSDILLLCDYVVMLIISSKSNIDYIVTLLTYLILLVYRDIWYDFYVRKIRHRHRNHNIFMHGRIICKSNDCHPAVLHI